MTLSFYKLWKSIVESPNHLEATRRKYLFGGLITAYLGAVDYIPNYGVEVYPFGYLAVLTYILLMGYAIARYRFLDIEVIVKKTLVFAGLFTMVMAVVVTVTALTQSYLGRYVKVTPTLATAVGVVVAILLYEPVRILLMRVTDRFLFQKKFKLTSIVRDASYAIALVRSLNWLARRIVAFLVAKCRIKSAVAYVSTDDKGFVCKAKRGFTRETEPPRILKGSDPVIRSLWRRRRPMEVSMLEERMEAVRTPDDLFAQDEKKVLEFLKRMKAEVVIPSFLRRPVEEAGAGVEEKKEGDEVILRSILILGGKKSDEPYSEEDLDVFYTLAQESAIAIENAKLYDEAVQKTRLLEQVNQELRDTNQRLQVTQASLIVAEKSATMVGMAKAIAHEVNNPLTTVSARAGWILQKDVKRAKDLLDRVNNTLPAEAAQELKARLSDIEEHAERIDRSGKRIAVVVATLTNLLKDTKGEMTPLSLLVLTREAIEATRFSTYEENIRNFEIKEIIAANVNVLGNVEQLIQVFVNLIKNAYEAMSAGQKGGRVEIRGEFDPEDPKMARIEVSDNGPGIPPPVIPKIWSQGFTTKVTKDKSLGAAGQGQGLFVSKHIIESIHKGRIWVESAPGKGTTFIIQLPLADSKGE